MSNNIIELKNISKAYTQAGEKLQILDNINFSIKAGEIVGFLGPSGCGKTTLLNICGLIDKADTGQTIINNQNCQNLSDSERTKMRGINIGFVYQFHHLLPDFTALENVMMPALVNNMYTKTEASKQAKDLLTSFGLQERLNYFPNQLSGGEQQRVAIARAMINNPKLILADEPTGNLDPATSEIVFEKMIANIKSYNLAALIVTHDHELINKFDRILTLQNKILEEIPHDKKS